MLACGTVLAVAITSGAQAATVIGRPAPAPPRPQAAAVSSAANSAGDPLHALGGNSPFCVKAAGAVAARNCRVSGSIAHAYPLSSYGIDNQVDVGLTNVKNNLLGALQNVGTLVWLALVFVIKGVLLMIEWGFSLDLVNRAMGAIVRGLNTLHHGVIGEPWFLAALSIAGLTGIWRGLVQRRPAQTIGGLATTVALMVVSLLIISRPEASVGHASQLANDAALGVVSATSKGTLAAPQTTFSTAMRGLFDTTVLRPWAALEFGDTAWAMAPAKRGAAVTNADVWLAFPTGSAQRRSLFRLQKGVPEAETSPLENLAGSIATGGSLGQAIGFLRGLTGGSLSDAVRSYVHKDPSKVRMQEADGTFPRLALLALIVIGLTGAILLFAYVGVRLLLASVMSLLLVLLAPAMLLAPAFGESGRASTIAWLKRLAAAVAAKLIYSLLLAILLIASSAIESLALGWFATWLILIAFWWGTLLKRAELLGFVSAGHTPAPSRGAGGGAMRALNGARIASRALSGAGRTGFALPALAGPPARHKHHEGRRPTPDAISDQARTELDGHLAERRDEAVREARSTLSRRPELEDELYSVDQALAAHDARVAAVEETPAGRGGKHRSRPSERPLLDRREQLRGQLDSEAFRSAAEVVAEAERANGQPAPGRAVRNREWRERRHVEVEHLAHDHPRNLRAAGVDPTVYRESDDETRAELSDRVRASIERDRRELAATPELQDEQGATPEPPVGRRAADAPREDAVALRRGVADRLAGGRSRSERGPGGGDPR